MYIYIYIICIYEYIYIYIYIYISLNRAICTLPLYSCIHKLPTASIRFTQQNTHYFVFYKHIFKSNVQNLIDFAVFNLAVASFCLQTF